MVCLPLTSCSMMGKGLGKLPWLKKKKDEPVQTDEGARLIGVVEMVNPEQRFVLVRTQGKILIPAGQELTAMDASGTTTKLKVSPEKKQDFLIADIVDGNPRAGNVVVFKLDRTALPPADPNTPPLGPGPGPAPGPPPSDPNVQPPPITPVTASEFTRPGAEPPLTRSPIPPQPVPAAESNATIPVPGQIQLPPVVR